MLLLQCSSVLYRGHKLHTLANLSLAPTPSSLYVNSATHHQTAEKFSLSLGCPSLSVKFVVRWPRVSFPLFKQNLTVSLYTVQEFNTSHFSTIHSYLHSKPHCHSKNQTSYHLQSLSIEVNT